MPGTHVALIRGINVGRAKRVAMSDLRTLFTALNYRDVRTVLNSGNVVFSAGRAKGQRIADRVQKEMVERLGVAARVLVLARADYAAVMEENALRSVASDPSRLLVVFCAEPAQLSKLEPLLRKDWSPEAIGIGGAAAYAWCAAGVLDSELLKAVGRALGDSTTTRNWATATRVHELLQSPGEARNAGRRSTTG